MVGRRDVLAGSALTLGAGALSVSVGGTHPRSAAAQPARPPGGAPNVIVILMDDLGYGDLGCYGHPLIRTPHLDRLARQGTRFTQGYSGAPVCSPSRAALLTGRVPPRTGIPDVLSRDDPHGLATRERTLPEYLRSAGYVTAAIGKWHLGRLDEHHPARHGFDSFFGVDAMYTADTYPTEVWRDGEPVEILRSDADLATLTRRFTDEAVDVIDRAGNRPFFLYLTETMPHLPLAVEPEFAGRSRGGLYGDAVESVDHHLGRLFDALADRGLDRDTLIIVTSDNGPWFEGSSGGLRSRKFEVFEGGVRVPFLARWTGTVPRGRESDDVVSFLDLLPTVCSLAGVEPEPGVALDGTDLTATLRGARLRERAPVPFFLGARAAAVRDGRWKLHVRRRGSDQRYLPELYDLDADPRESVNLTARQPEVTARLREFLTALEEDIAREQRPPVALAADLPLLAGRPATVRVRLTRALRPGGEPVAEVTVSLTAPDGWATTTVRQVVDLDTEPVLDVEVTPPAAVGAPAGRLATYELTPRAEVDGRTVPGEPVRVYAVPHGDDVALALDAGPAGSPVTPSYRALTPDSSWAETAGYGWAGGTPAPLSRDRGAPDVLRRDMVNNQPAALLRLRLPAGPRTISVLRGDDGYATPGIVVAADGTEVIAPGPQVPAGAYQWEEFTLDGGDSGRVTELRVSAPDTANWKIVALLVR
ncbi:sulfatase-like hydrolase/transferase [Streptomyces sp. WMMC500]|uniref:sulfatase-like hydrolase/transferase n=1 Tax=Streptomyces sp. WMMC500 TaxID=3015154 RepID=UPI00248C3698|nr:sulfatase-like hydrolase/transferase [Streptomyces sp. WMMC500]WBB62095.1 sulfatase-like hydrolase/transferase [Streptomyces sp. WMMC500]